MKILITSGGTSEKIDQVRSITNQATGQLGKMMAETFLAAGHQVTLVCGRQAVRPNSQKNLIVQTVTDVQNLIDTLQPLVKTHHALIHAMAVSDYTPVYMTDLNTAVQSQDLTEFLNCNQQEGKISSHADYQVLFLKKTPKVISLVKAWNPDIRLIGFKLLVGSEKADLIQTARASLIQNKADFILANDLTQISPDQHLAYLVGPESQDSAATKQEIAELILKKLTERN